MSADEGRSAVDWEALGYPEVPHWVAFLRSDSEEVRDQAHTMLNENGFSEPTRQALALLPTYFALLRDPQTPDRELLLRIMAKLAGYWKASFAADPAAEIARELHRRIAEQSTLWRRLAEEEDLQNAAKRVLWILKRSQA